MAQPAQLAKQVIAVFTPGDSHDLAHLCLSEGKIVYRTVNYRLKESLYVEWMSLEVLIWDVGRGG